MDSKQRKVIIASDYTCDLSSELINQHDIKLTSLYVTFGKEVYKDCVTLTTDELYSKVDELGTLPKTAAVSPQDFIDFFTPFIEQGFDIVYTGIGGSISSTCNNAHLASLQFEEGRIFVVDSKNLSSATGLIVLKMAKWRDEGFSAKEIAKKAEEIVPFIHGQFSVAHLEYLHKGGRCSGTVRFFGTMLRVRPIIRIKNGVLVLDDKVYGKYEKALNLMIKDIESNVDILDPDYVMVTHSKADEEAKYILANLPESVKNKVKHIEKTEAGCVISSHCGKRTIGILYITTK